MKRQLIMTAAVAAMFAVGTSAHAGGISFSLGGANGFSRGFNNFSNYGYGNQGYYGGSNCNSNRGYSNFRYGSGYRGFSSPYSNFGNVRNHGGHFDYYRPSYRFHGNQFDRTPRHYDYHRNGHRGH